MDIDVGRSESPNYSDINMTPLIDILLVLLIIFIITIPSQTHAIKIDSPMPTSDPPASPRAVIVLSIDFDGTLYWNGQRVTRTAMQSSISRVAAQIPQPEVHITVDKFAKYGIVAQTVADMQQRGLQMIGFLNDEGR